MNSKAESGLIKGISRRIALFCVAVLILAMSATAQSGPSIIVIDPGHGGRDTGARGPTGLMEKTVSLEIARKMAQMLEPEFQVILTRSDDYNVDLLQRTAVANQSQALLMISIHTGGGFLHRTEGAGVFYYAPPKGDGGPATDPNDEDTNQLWSQAQQRHKHASIDLADAMHAALTGQAAGIDRKIQGAPLRVLEGADLPAVLVEVGYITHPATEMNLSSDQGIESLSQALANAIRSYVRHADFSARSTP